MTQEEAQGLLDSYNEKKYSVMNYSKEQLSSLQMALGVNGDNTLFRNEELKALKEKAKGEAQVIEGEKNNDFLVKGNEDINNINLEINEVFQSIDIDWTQVDNPNYKNDRLKSVSGLMQSKMNLLEGKFMAPVSKLFNVGESNQALTELTNQFREHDINNDGITTTGEIMHSIGLISKDDIEEYTILETKMLDKLSKTEVQEKLQKILRSPDVSLTVMTRIQKDIPDVFENFKSMVAFSMNAIAKHNNI